MSTNPRQPMTDLIIVLPGILGSTLSRNDHEVWGLSVGGLARNLWSLGQNYKDLELPEDIGDNEPNDGFVATGLMPTTVMIPELWKVDGYTGLVEYLEARFDVRRPAKDHAGNLIEFPYDWRLSNRLSGQKLHDVAHPALERWRKETKNPEAKLILIAHSMGGLVSRWFLECLGGKDVTRYLITLGTPYRGSINAVTQLCNGLTKKLGPLQFSLDTVVRSLPGLFQLLPTYDCVEGPGGTLSSVDKVALPNIRAAAVADALAFHAQIAAKVSTTPSYEIFVLKGAEQPTAQSVKFSQNAAVPLNIYDGKDRFGDGTVPRMSSHPPEWGNDAAAGYFGLQHGSLPADPDIYRQLYGILTSANLSKLMGGTKLGLEMPDVIESGEALDIQVRAEDGDPNLTLEVELAGEDGKKSVTNLPPSGGGIYRASVKDLTPQGYTATVRSYGPIPVSNVTAPTLVWDGIAAGD